MVPYPDDSLIAKKGANAKVGDIFWHLRSDNELNHSVCRVVVEEIEHLFLDVYKFTVRGDDFTKTFTAGPASYVSLYFDTKEIAETYLAQCESYLAQYRRNGG